MSERIWAGWRMAYIRAAAGEPESGGAKCLFCGLAVRPAGLDSLVLERYGHSLLVMNAFPYTAGHIMVAPLDHVDAMTCGSPETGAEVLAALERARSALTAMSSPHGFNVGVNLGRAAGAGVPGHVHWHLVPRWRGDTNFMPALADVRVIPESLSETYGRLVSVLAALPAEGLTVTARGAC